jgi:excisionase family DNA binding protein
MHNTVQTSPPRYSFNYYPGRSAQPSATQIYWTKLKEYSSKPTLKCPVVRRSHVHRDHPGQQRKEITMEHPLAHTIAEASARSGIGRTTIYELINSGKLPARKRGRRTLILSDDLRRCLESLPPITVKPNTQIAD